MGTKNSDTWLQSRCVVRNTYRNLIKTTSKTSLLRRNRTGVSKPHWKDLIKQRVNASTALSGTWSLIESEAGGQTHTFSYNPALGEAPNANGTMVSTNSCWGHHAAQYLSEPSWTPWSSVADGRARNNFLSKVRQVQTKMQGAVFLKEMDQTWHMLRRPASALWDNIGAYYAALRKAKRRSPLGWYTALPSLWLEYSFGWKPLMMDIDDAFKALNELTERDRVVRVVGNGSDQKLKSDVSGSSSWDSSGAPYISFRYRNRTIMTETCRYIGGVRFQALTTFADKAAQWGFTPTEFLPSAWEILPWSFLIDYFVTIGDYLDATFADTSSIVWCVKTVRQKTELSIVHNPALDLDRVAATKVLFGQPSTALWRKLDVNRVPVNGGSLTPDLYIKWSGPTLGQFANMSALFGQANANLHNQRLSGKTFRK